VFLLDQRKVSQSFLAICFLLLGQLVFSQSTGSIRGTVYDAAGSVIPNANVTVKNDATGEDHTTRTDVSGVYSVPRWA
jgi:hypothetical protein